MHLVPLRSLTSYKTNIAAIISMEAAQQELVMMMLPVTILIGELDGCPNDAHFNWFNKANLKMLLHITRELSTLCGQLQSLAMSLVMCVTSFSYTG